MQSIHTTEVPMIRRLAHAVPAISVQTPFIIALFPMAAYALSWP